MSDEVNPGSAYQLHHLGYLVKDIPSSVQEFAARFGYVVESDVIHDPVQTAYVQFLRLPGAAFWLELITPDGDKSKLSRSLEKGGGLHHTCYEVDDIDAAGAHLRTQAMLMVAVPTPAAAFPGRRISWFMDRSLMLVELVERGEGPLSLCSIQGTIQG